MLLGGLPSEQAASLRKTLKPLANASSAGKETDTTVLGEEVARLTAAEKAILERERQRKQDAKLRNPLKMSGALPAPLAPLHQAKIERQAARERMDDEIHKWDDTVKASACILFRNAPAFCRLTAVSLVSARHRKGWRRSD